MNRCIPKNFRKLYLWPWCRGHWDSNLSKIGSTSVAGVTTIPYQCLTAENKIVGPAAERTRRSRLCQLLGVSVVATSISQQDTSHTRVIWSCSCIQMCRSQHVCRWLQQVYQSAYSEAFCSVWQQSWRETSLKATEPKTKRNQEVRGLKAVTLREVQDPVIILCDFVSIGNSFHMVLFVHINMWRTAASTLGWRFYINAFTETVVILSDLDNFHPVFFWNSNVTEHLRGLVSPKRKNTPTHTHTASAKLPSTLSKQQ